jgi:[citrate (pro-3S)-lyase] ligase
LHHKEQIEATHCELDLMIFVERFAKPLNITRRFVGSEPLSPVTHLYNQALQTILPRHGIATVVVPRMEADGMAISASRVRDLIRMGRMDEIKQRVPLTTYEYLERLDYDGAH